jgi:hypothetical protein
MSDKQYGMSDDRSGLGGMCYALKPGGVLRCRKTLGHKGDHYNWPLKLAWPNTEAAKAAT